MRKRRVRLKVSEAWILRSWTAEQAPPSWMTSKVSGQGSRVPDKGRKPPGYGLPGPTRQTHVFLPEKVSCGVRAI